MSWDWTDYGTEGNTEPVWIDDPWVVAPTSVQPDAPDLTDFWKSLTPANIMKLLGPTGTAIGAQGVASLLNQTMKGDPLPKAYPGGIPNLVASRQMLPIPTTTTTAGGQTVPRRPGSGGVTYFSPMQYTAATPPAGSTATDETIPGSTGVSPPGTTVVPGQEVGPGGYAQGGLAGLGYAKGRLLNGPGDGVSDSIPATIDGDQPAALADGEYVIPARIVSELGNGSTKAGAKQLDAMMKRIQASRRKATDIAANTRVDKHLPA
tara:strand:- start:40 stop:828 length:789 start_codon:yes stop_codon:yes gene_type:complete